jgi:hypothetical protein
MTRKAFLPAMLLMNAMAVGAAAQTAGGTLAASMTGAMTLRENMRHLWADHVVWMRQYIVATVDDDGSAPAALTRLMRNQEDIGNAIKPFYGDAAADKLTALFKRHIELAGELLGAAKVGNDAKKTEADKRWRENAEEIAAFLANANPKNWTKSGLRAMLDRHLAITTQEAVDRLQKNWSDDVRTFDMIFNQAMEMADALSDGIVKQFPTKV